MVHKPVSKGVVYEPVRVREKGRGLRDCQSVDYDPVSISERKVGYEQVSNSERGVASKAVLGIGI